MGFLLTCWALSVLLFLKIPPLINIQGTALDVELHPDPLPANEFGPFAVWHHTPKDEKMRYAMAFDKIRIANGKLGIFQTGLYQTALIDNLRLHLVSCPPAPASPSTGNTPVPLSNKKLDDEILADALFFNKNHPNVQMPDMSRTVSFRVRDFNFRYGSSQDAALLKISSKLAFFNVNSSDQLTLKGHVKLENNTRLIEANAVIWNLEDQTFNIDGRYFETVNNHKEYGTDICLDTELNSIQPIVKQIREGTNVCLRN